MSLKLIDVISQRNITFDELRIFLPFRNVEKIEFGFMPDWLEILFDMKEYEQDPLFVRGLRCDFGDFKFPEISFTWKLIK